MMHALCGVVKKKKRKKENIKWVEILEIDNYFQVHIRSHLQR